MHLVWGAPGGGAPGAGADPVETAWRRFVGDRRRMGEIDYFITMAKSRALAAHPGVRRAAPEHPLAPHAGPLREKVAPVIEVMWADTASAPSLVQALSLMRLESQYEKLAAYNQNKPK